MRALFWISFGIVLYAYFAYPALISLAARLFPRAWKRQPIDLSVSVLMAVHNEAARLPEQIRHLSSLDPSRVKQILIVSDGSTDASAQILSEVRDPRISIILLDQQQGKAAALNHAIAAAKCDILLFVDIRPRLATGSLEELLSNFADPAVGCAAGELLLQTHKHDPAAAAVSGLYWRYEQWIRNCEAAWDSPVGVYGGFYAVRRNLATAFPPGLILDDMFQPLAIIRQGYRSVLDRAACVIDSWPPSAGREFHRKVRTLAGNFQLLALAPWITSPRNRVLIQLVSHKLLRLAVPYCFLFMLFASAWLGTHSMPWALAAAIQCLFWGTALAGLRFAIPGLQRVTSASGALLLLNAAAVIGLYKFLFTAGPLWKIWLDQKSPTSRAISLHPERESA